MPERPKGHDWKSCVPTKIGTEGSNPSLSAMHHVGCMASPELYVVQGAIWFAVWLALYPAWYRAPSLVIMYYVYVLRSQLDKNLHIGYTTDLRERFRKHQNGEVISTEFRRPFELIFYEGYKSMKDAKRREAYLKSSKGKSSLNLMLRDSLK